MKIPFVLVWPSGSAGRKSRKIREYRDTARLPGRHSSGSPFVRIFWAPACQDVIADHQDSIPRRNDRSLLPSTIEKTCDSLYASAFLSVRCSCRSGDKPYPIAAADGAAPHDRRIHPDIALIVLDRRAQYPTILRQLSLGQGSHHTAPAGARDAQRTSSPMASV
jgi:hypothetical protein